MATAKIHNILYEYDYDIVCLQEVELNNDKNKDSDIYTSFKDEFKNLLKYKSYNFVEQTFKKKNNGVGSVIIYKKDKFETITSDSKSCGVICILNDKINNINLCITNIHLRAKYSNEDERINQIVSIINSIEKITSVINTNRPVDIIICGDFNTVAKYKLQIPSGRNSVIDILRHRNNKTRPHNIILKEISISSDYTYFSPYGTGHDMIIYFIQIH